MAYKNKEQIENAMYVALQDYMTTKIAGAFYPSECRPTDSQAEDAVLTVSSGDTEQIQSGVARLNIYVPDIDAGDGWVVPDKQRLINLSALDEQIINVLNDAYKDYLFELDRMTSTIAVPGVKQHFVCITIAFHVTTF